MKPGWYPSLEFCAQSAHVGWCGFLTLLLCLYASPRCVSGLVVLVLLKEFVFDLAVEAGETWQESAKDAAFCGLGILLGLASMMPFWIAERT